jgi:hypothetical protein
LLKNPETLPEIFARVFFEHPPISCALAIEPYRMNEGLTVQQGCLLCPGDVRRSFEENLLQSSKPQDAQGYIKKLVILQGTRNDAFHDLYLMNINRASLFPGLDGFAQSLKHEFWSANAEQFARMLEESFISHRMREMAKQLKNVNHIKPVVIEDN